MKSIVLNASSIEDLIEKIDRQDITYFKPSVAFIYVSIIYDLEKLVSRLAKYPFIVVGSTTAGEISADTTIGVGTNEDSIVCMLVDIDPSAISFKLLDVVDDNYIQIGEKIALWAKKEFEEPALITISSGLSFNTERYTETILSYGIKDIYGGLSADDLKIEGTFVFSKDSVCSKGVVVLALDRSKVDIVGAVAFGWVGIGKDRIVTKSYKNIVYEIDGKPAIEFYKRYLNIDIDSMPQIGIEYPLEVKRDDGSFVRRALLDIDKSSGALIFGGDIKENNYVRLSSSEGKNMIGYVGESIQKALDENEMFTPEVSLIFSCCSRKQVLNKLVVKEVESAYEVAPVPTVGFFSYGEICSCNGSDNIFYNETFVTVLLSERRV